MSDGSKPLTWVSWRQVLALAVLVLALIFVFQNRIRVDIRVLVPVVTMPLWLALLASLVAGVLIGVALVWRPQRMHR